MRSKIVGTGTFTALLSLGLLLAVTPASAGSCSTSGPSDLVDTAVAAGSFNTLVAAVEAAGLVDALKGDGPLTVFAPTDEAFARLPQGTLESLLQPENRDRLVSILTYHVAPGRLTADKVVRSEQVETLNGQRPRVRVTGDTVRIDQAKIVEVDIAASNGVIHVIDRVILPRQMPSANARPAMELIEMAIDRGAPMYNNGQPAACAAIYEMIAQSLVRLEASGLAESDRERLHRAMRESSRTHDAGDRAWVMRRALDDVYHSLSERPTDSAMLLPR